VRKSSFKFLISNSANISCRSRISEFPAIVLFWPQDMRCVPKEPRQVQFVRLTVLETVWFSYLATMKNISLLVVDDEALVREGLRALLEKEETVKAVYEAWDKQTVLRQLENEVDIVLLDVRLQGLSGLELVESIQKIANAPKIIAVTGLEGVEVVVNLLKLGVQGIVFKLDGYQDIWNAINKVMEEDHYYPEKIVRIIQGNAYRWDQTPPVTLNFSEKELLRGIAQGLTNKEIARVLKMSPATIETYRVRLIKKLNVPNTASLMAYAFRNGLL